MDRWVVAVCTAAMLCSIVTAIKGGEERSGKALSFLCSVVMLSVTLYPLPSLVSKLSGKWETVPFFGHQEEDPADSSASLWVLEQSSKEISRQISEYASTVMGIDVSGMSISLTLDTADVSSVVIKAVTVDMRACAVISGANELERELEKMLGCSVKVLVR